MRLIRGLPRVKPSAGSVATIGNYDGVHLGHKAIFTQTCRAALSHGLPACVISFEPLPHEYFAGANAAHRLQGLRDRINSIRDCNIDQLLLLHFDDAFAAQSANHFIEHTLVSKLAVKHLIVGDDFRFGHQRQGDFALLQQAGELHGFSVEQTQTVLDDGQRISSSRIRQALRDTDLATAARLLGRDYRISGRVIHGEKVGRQLGFPTANVALKTHRPALRGVFAVIATDSDTGVSYNGVANLGERPTVGGRKLLLEVHVLDAEADFYGHHLNVDFIQFIRGEQKFGSLDELKAAISDDANRARSILNGNPKAHITD